MATLTSIDLKLEKIATSVSNTNQRVSRIEEWKIITEVKLIEVEKQSAILNQTRGIGVAVIVAWTIFVFLAPRLKFRKGITK